MKRIFILVVVALLAVGSSFAEEKTLIDFSGLIADITVNGQGDDPPNQNQATLMDFNNQTIGNLTTRQKNTMQSSLAIANWDVVLASSSRNVTTKHLSYTKEVTSKAFDKVMGVRIHFPLEPFNSWAAVKPPFDIPAFEPPQADPDADADADSDGITGPSRFEDGFGVIKNVGAIKSIAVNVYGLNFPHSLSVILIDEHGKENTYFMGYLNFEEWGELRWDNPAYIKEVRNRELRTAPLYPDTMPYVKFGGFVIQKLANMKGGDFITYFKDVKVIYDQAVLEQDRDINDELEWNIIQTRDTQRKNTEMQRLGQLEHQRTLDRQRQATEGDPTFQRTPGNDNNDDQE